MHRSELADFLRRHRERLAPAEVGLGPTARHRRTPGLRREEVAGLADVSVSYYERLEQARAPRPSPQVLAALARALRLDAAERRYLAGVAGQEAPQPGAPPADVPPGVLALLRGMTETPAYVLNPKYDVLAWNPPAAALIADFGALAPGDRNALRIAFGPAGRISCGPRGTARFVEQVVAELRQAAIRYPRDVEIPALIGWLAARNPGFRDAWAEHGVREQAAIGKRFVHPELGVLELDAQTLHIPESDQRLVVYSAEPGSPAAAALRGLRDGAAH